MTKSKEIRINLFGLVMRVAQLVKIVATLFSNDPTSIFTKLHSWAVVVA